MHHFHDVKAQSTDVYFLDKKSVFMKIQQNSFGAKAGNISVNLYLLSLIQT